MCQIKTFLVLLAFLVAARFCIDTVHTETKWTTDLKQEKKPCEKEYKGFCLNY